MRWMGRVLTGKFGGGVEEMGILKYLDKRRRSALIQVDLSGESVSWGSWVGGWGEGMGTFDG